VLIRALRDMSISTLTYKLILVHLYSLKIVDMPKLVGEDLQLFMGIMSDLFPGSELPEPSYGTLQVAIEVFFQK
jgi:hypothetical protein